VRFVVAAFVSMLSMASIVCVAGCKHQETPREHAILRVVRGDLRGGTKELEALRDASPKDPRAWIDLGHAYELAHRYEDALDCYDRAAEIAPTSPDGPREGGLRAAAWGEYEAAKPRLLEAIARGDRVIDTYHGLGLVELQLGDHEAAKKAYLQGLDQPGGDHDATCVLGLATLAVVEEDAKGALHWYDELARRRPELAGAEFGRAWALTKLRKFDDAIQALDAAASLGGRAEDVTRMRNWIAEERGRKG
jgi:tetratricopeptide (TPR) repeat protein